MGGLPVRAENLCRRNQGQPRRVAARSPAAYAGPRTSLCPAPPDAPAGHQNRRPDREERQEMSVAHNGPPTTKHAPVPDFDPAVKMPASVLAASARADQLFHESQGTEQPEQPQPEQPELPLDTGTVSEPQQQPAPQSRPQEDSWEHRYNSMKGRYDRANEQLRNMSEQISNMQHVIATMQQPAAAPPELRAERLISPEEENDYGREFLDVVGKKAKEEFTPEVAELRSELA